MDIFVLVIIMLVEALIQTTLVQEHKDNTINTKVHKVLMCLGQPYLHQLNQIQLLGSRNISCFPTPCIHTLNHKFPRCTKYFLFFLTSVFLIVTKDIILSQPGSNCDYMC